MLNKSLIIACLFLLSSCLKRIDGPIPIEISPYPSIEINLKYPDYSDKVYYNLETKSIVKTSKSMDWSLAFTNSPNLSQKVIMNYAQGTACNGFTLNDTLWTRVANEDLYNTNVLRYANHYDSFANLFEANFANGTNQRYVYYLNFGKYDVFYKFQILEMTSTSVTIRFAQLDGSNEKTAVIALNPSTNYTYFSLKDNIVKDIEPADNTSWDIEFTRYTTLVTEFNDTRMYAVGGVINNPQKKIRVALVDNTKIESIDSLNVSNYNYSSDLAKIGYGWKKFSSGSVDGFYTILTRTYLVNSSNKFYGIQFTGYSKLVNNTEMNGYPTFLLRNF